MFATVYLGFNRDFFVAAKVTICALHFPASSMRPRFFDLGKLTADQSEPDGAISSCARMDGAMRRRKVSKDPRKEAERVARAIDAAIERVSERDPILGRILRETIETGDYLSYTPKPKRES
jgi:hypothetical protein